MLSQFKFNLSYCMHVCILSANIPKLLGKIFGCIDSSLTFTFLLFSLGQNQIVQGEGILPLFISWKKRVYWSCTILDSMQAMSLIFKIMFPYFVNASGSHTVAYLGHDLIFCGLFKVS